MQCATITNCESYSPTDCKCTKCKQYFTPAANGQSCTVCQRANGSNLYGWQRGTPLVEMSRWLLVEGCTMSGWCFSQKQAG